ncbi:MAG: TlpA family protein disulfide reductase [Herbiconiux sp.]|uniref:TlpA family protein disulfide reductase n=1 Tax=Herbiconiux sp. TaxID=1871186 RepID=UPI0011F8A9F3|nr:TlpA disulfide reductase family protein [Herbiconiux sp.]TAJ47984.1 MAG: TlpA family protein disulfide reductase [Herbiconiux sp.]
MKLPRTLRAAVAVAAVGATLLLAACTSDPLAQQYLNGDNKGYISGDGTVTEVAEADRGAPVQFEGTDVEGNTISSSDYAGKVLVLNFWYAGCAPCRAEAPLLEQLNTEHQGADVSFLGVNVRDQADTALSFEKNYGITYPSIVDTDGALQFAFSGTVAPNAVPTTLVLDTQGRVAARILGRVSEASILDTLITSNLAG